LSAEWFNNKVQDIVLTRNVWLGGTDGGNSKPCHPRSNVNLTDIFTKGKDMVIRRGKGKMER